MQQQNKYIFLLYGSPIVDAMSFLRDFPHSPPPLHPPSPLTPPPGLKGQEKGESAMS